MKGGWKSVFRRRTRRAGASLNLYIVFVDDIPDSMSPKGLFTIFTNFGIVKDVFKPNKRRKATQSRFGFVRYDCRIVAGVVMKKANGVWCEDKTLKVKKGDYGKEQTGKEKIQEKEGPIKQ
ncbi:hypothetical protein ACSBR1_029627 [Camellia fascicularis]